MADTLLRLESANPIHWWAEISRLNCLYLALTGIWFKSSEFYLCGQSFADLWLPEFLNRWDRRSRTTKILPTYLTPVFACVQSPTTAPCSFLHSKQQARPKLPGSRDHFRDKWLHSRSI